MSILDCARGFHDADEGGETCTVCGSDLSASQEKPLPFREEDLRTLMAASLQDESLVPPVALAICRMANDTGVTCHAVVLAGVELTSWLEDEHDVDVDGMSEERIVELAAELMKEEEQ